MLIDPTRSILPSFGAALVLAWLLSLLADWANNQTGPDSGAPRRWVHLRYAVALAVSIFVGVVLLREPGPAKFWHWTWCAGVAGLVVEGSRLPVSGWKGTLTRVTTIIVAGGVVAWMLVPKWADPDPGWMTVWLLLSLYLVALTLAFQFASTSAIKREISEELPRQLVIAQAATCMCLAAAIAASVSLKYAELTSVIAVGVTGCLIAHGRRRGSDRSLSALAFVTAFLMGSVTFVGVIYPQKPVLRLLPIPFAPLVLLSAVHFFKTDSWRDISLRYTIFAVAVASLTLFAVVF